MRRIVAKLQVCPVRDHLLNDIQIARHHRHREWCMAIFPQQVWIPPFSASIFTSATFPEAAAMWKADEPGGAGLIRTSPAGPGVG